MAQRVFLHIGTMKAATTYLQHSFDRNRAMLAENGILWLGNQRNMQAVMDWRGSGRLLPGREGGWESFRREIMAWNGDALVSMELLAELSAPAVQRLADQLRPAELRVVITARDLTRTVPSHWQETTQNRRTTAWDEYAEQVTSHDPADRDDPNLFWRHHHLPTIIRAWSTVVDPTTITLVTVPKPGASPDVVWHRFAETIGTSSESFVQPGFNNSALGAHSAELMRRVNQEVAHLDWPHYRWGFKAALAKQTLARRASVESRPTLSKEQFLRLRERVEVMLGEVGEQHVRIVGDLDDLLPAADPPASDGAPAGPTDAELLDAAVAGLAGLGERVANLRIERDDLRERLKEMKPRHNVDVPGLRDRAVNVLRQGYRAVRGRARR